MLDIINELFINCAIIIASITFANMLVRQKIVRPILLNRHVNGLFAGLLGCLLMLYSVSISPEIILDFRFLPVITVALYISFASSVEAALIISIFRVAYFGINKASVISAIVTIIIGIGCAYIGRLSSSSKIKWAFSLALICVGSSIGLALVISDLFLLAHVLLAFLSSMSIACLAMYFFMEFISLSNRQFNKMKEETEKDFLTDLHNVRHFDKTLNQCVVNSINEQRSLSLLFIDIDHFKKVNDQFGHLDGDEVLKSLSRILRDLARSQDIVSRKGGEEFTVLLVDCRIEQAVAVGERIRSTIENYDFMLSGNRSTRITVSIGIASIPETTTEEEKLVEQADIALYQAKRAGRNRIVTALSQND